MMESKGQPSDWQMLKKSMPWRDFTLGFIIPKVIFYVSMNKPWLLAGVTAAVIWCVAVFIAQYIIARKTNWFAILAFALILIQLIPVIIKDDPNMNFIAGAFTTFLFGMIFLISIIIKKPLIQAFAEKTGARAHIPQEILNSPYYVKTWEIITAVWAVVYILEAAVLLILALGRSRALVAFDIFSGWPTIVFMIFFSIQFPKWYWARKKS